MNTIGSERHINVNAAEDYSYRQAILRSVADELRKKFSLRLQQALVQVDAPFTSVTLRAVMFGTAEFAGVGFSKCNPIDGWDSRVGFKTALDRAIKNLVSFQSIATNERVVQ